MPLEWNFFEQSFEYVRDKLDWIRNDQDPSIWSALVFWDSSKIHSTYFYLKFLVLVLTSTIELTYQ